MSSPSVVRIVATGLAALLAAGVPVSRAADEVEKYYHLDAVGSVRAITDRNGNVLEERFDYHPYGEDVAPHTTTNTRRFTGKERDPETAILGGLDYFGARYYFGRIARFTSVDPVYSWQENLVDPQRWNRYAYARNNPLRYVDPDGRELRTTAQETINAIAGGAAARVAIRNGVVDASGLTAADLSGNEGALLLNQLASSKNVYSYAEGSTIQSAAGPQKLSSAAANLDNAYDSRFDYKGGKGSSEIPPAGVDASVVVNPRVGMVDQATGKKGVSPNAIAFHELAEAYGRVDRGLSYAGAHSGSAARERTLVQQRPGFTQGLAGDPVKKRDPQ